MLIIFSALAAQVATQTAATDPRTGTIDMDMIATGRSSLDRDLVLRLAAQLRLVVAACPGQRLTVGQLRQMVVRDGGLGGGGDGAGGGPTVAMAEVEAAVRELETDGLLQFVARTHTAIIPSNIQ